MLRSGSLTNEAVKNCECCRTSKQLIEQLKKDLLLKETQVTELNRQLFAQVEENERQVAIQKEQVSFS